MLLPRIQSSLSFPRLSRYRIRDQGFSSSSQVRSRARFPSDTRVLFVSNLHPEPHASAAGVRTLRLLEKLRECPGIESIHYATPSTKPPTLGALDDVHWHGWTPNQSTQAQEFLTQTLPTAQHWLVIFDRFYTEEMYSHYIHEHWPEAVCVLDMQDVHSLRTARRPPQNGGKDGILVSNDSTDWDQLLLSRDESSMWWRELASIHRSDLTLVCSPVEMDILQSRGGLAATKLCWAPLLTVRFVVRHPNLNSMALER